MPLGKNGEPYEPLTERQLKAIRARPYPTEVTRLRALLDKRAEQLAREHRPEPIEPDEAPRPRRQPKTTKRGTKRRTR